MECPPRFATRRRPQRETLGHRIGYYGQKLGTPLMEFQQYIADVGMEIKEYTRTGLAVMAYREIIVTVPRQNGKTTLVLSWEIDRALSFKRRTLISYSAQTGQDGRKKLLEDQVPQIETSPLASIIAPGGVRKKNGEEGINFANGSKLDVLATQEASGHGRTRDLCVVDEAFTDTDDRREQAVIPSMATIADAQLFVCSTMGTDRSLYFNRKVETGRAIALADSDDSEIAYFEWSAAEDEDIDDPRTWRGCMPAYDYTITERVVRHARQTMPEGEFRRAFLNQRTNSDERVIPLDVWSRVNNPKTAPDGTVLFAVDCDPEHTWSSIAVADLDGRIELLNHERGTGWLVPQVADYAKKWGSVRVAYDPSGPGGYFGDELAKAGVKTVKVAGQDIGHACSYFYNGVIDNKLRIRPHEALNAAVAAATRAVSGDTWRWSRRNETDISPLVAVTLASWAVVHAQKPVFLY